MTATATRGLVGELYPVLVMSCDPVSLVSATTPLWLEGDSLMTYLAAVEDTTGKLLSYLPALSHTNVNEAMMAGVRKQLFPHRLSALDLVLKDVLASTNPVHVRACSATTVAELLQLIRGAVELPATYVEVNS